MDLFEYIPSSDRMRMKQPTASFLGNAIHARKE